MELNRKHNRKPSITQLIDHAQLHVYTKANLYKSRTSRKYNNLSAEFEALTGKIPIISILVTCASPTRQIVCSGMNIREG